MTEFPKREFFLKPVLQAIQELGGSGTNDEINNKVIEILKNTRRFISVNA